jgi:hypothetical protein
VEHLRTRLVKWKLYANVLRVRVAHRFALVL